MSERITFTLAPAPHPARANCLRAVQEAPDGSLVEIRPGGKRTSRQNALMWAVLAELTTKPWHGEMLTREEWKTVITAGLKRQRAVPGVDGGFVVLGEQTHKMSVQEMAQVIELAYAIGAQQGITFTAKEMP